MMSPRERWLAAVEMRPVDRLPFWPKLNGSYPRAQNAPFNEMPIDEIHDWIGSDKHVGIGGCVRETRSKTSVENTREGNLLTTRYSTPSGAMTAVSQFDIPSQSWHPRKFPVEALDDVALMVECYEDTTVELDEEALARTTALVERYGAEASTFSGMGTSALMRWVEHIAGVEQAHLLLMEYPDQVGGLFEAMHRALRQRVEITCDHCPADFLYLSENTSTSLISPDQYRTWDLPHLREYARIARDKNRRLVLHMCGLLKRLLPDLATLPVSAFEAFTSPTLADTTLLDGRGGCPDVCLIGGTNATLWTRPADRIIAKLEEDLAEMPHHRGVVVTSAGVMPPLASPDTIKTVCDWVKNYDARM